MASHSASEGEIIESDTEKATTALPSANGTSVNRKLREALSPSPIRSPYSRSPSVQSRDRSRSPYRASKSPRGEKRRRDDDHHGDRARPDPRRFKVRHEEPLVQREGKHGHGQQHGSRNRESRDSYNRYDDRGRRNRHRRRRSHSPHDFTRHDGRHSRPDRNSREEPEDGRIRGGYSTDKYGYDRSRKSRVNEQSVSARGAGTLPNDQIANQETEHSAASSEQELSSIRELEKSERSGGAFLHRVNEPMDSGSEPAPQSATNEPLSLEERRKRREAVKAKYKGNPILAQALQLENTPGTSPSQPRTPSYKSDEPGSPQSQTPSTPQHDSGHGSPPSFVVSDDADLANSDATAVAAAAPGNAEEPSAADYDPTMDMQEDRFRNEKRQQGDDLYARHQDGAEPVNKPMSIPEPALEGKEEPQSRKAKAADDMFASDDEDDMFAPIAPNKTGTFDSKTSKAASLPKAKQLDESLQDNWDDPDGYYRIIPEELLDGRYQVQANLGRGMFSSVVRATDTKADQLVAIKIIRNNETMIKAGTKEMEILQKLADADPEDKKHVIRLIRSFTHKGHLCMVFENLNINLREVLKKFGRDVGINLRAVRLYAQQIFLGLSLLRKCNILHADLKPDNILVNEQRNRLKICDLGSAADASENEITPYLVSRFYRAPEIILGMQYDFAIDMWSVGCTLFELYTGKILFTGRTNNQMLRSIMECRGKFSLKMLKKAEYGAVHFDDQNLNFRSVERDKVTGRDVTRLINFVRPTRDLKSRLLATAGSGSGSGSKVLPEAELRELNLFADLLDRCLALNPEKRLTPTEALKHPFIHRATGVVGKG